MMMAVEEEQIENLVRDDSGEGANDVSRGAQSVDYYELEPWVGYLVWIGRRRHMSCSRNQSCSGAAVVVVDRLDCNCRTCWNHSDVVRGAAADDYCDCRDVGCQNLGPERTASSESHPTMSAVVDDLVQSYHEEHHPVAGLTAEHPSMAHPIPLVT